MKRKTTSKRTAGSRAGGPRSRAGGRASAPPGGVSFVAAAIRVRKIGGRIEVEAVPQAAAAPGGLGGGKGCRVRWHPGVSKPLCEGRCKVSSQWCNLHESRYGNWVHYSCRCGPPMDEPTPF